jgi:hypothetical protein
MPALPLLAPAMLLARLAGPFPFAVGETLQYEARLGMFPIGQATVAVSKMDREAGEDVFVFSATGQGGPPGLRARYDMTSWTTSASFTSLRFDRRLVQGKSVDEEHYHIIPDSSRYRIEGKPGDWVAPRNPLDELAFLYYLRTVPMRVGGSYQIPRYFKNGYNPIQVRVLSRDTIKLPDGRSVPVLAVEATGKNITVGVRYTDDARRLPVQIDLPLPYGSVTLELTGGA